MRASKEEKVRRKSGLTAPWAVVISAVVGAVSAIAVKSVEALGAKERAAPRDPPLANTGPSAATGPGLGQWVGDLKQNVAYKAESDGFIAAVSGGAQPSAGVEVHTGDSPNTLKMRIRVASSYDGALLPVRKGEYWLVRPWNGSGQISIGWLPLGI